MMVERTLGKLAMKWKGIVAISGKRKAILPSWFLTKREGTMQNFSSGDRLQNGMLSLSRKQMSINARDKKNT